MHTTCQTIDTRWGSDNHPHYSHGNTLPYTGVPFGMNYFLPQTTHEQGAWFSTPIFLFFRAFASPTSLVPGSETTLGASSRPSQEKLQVPTSSVVKAVIR